MTESGGAGRGKTLAWRSRSSRDMDVDKDMGNRDAVGSVSGRDFGRDIANWWTSAVEQTSTFIRDEVPATFAGISVGAKELKPTLKRGTSFSTFTLPWKISTVDDSKEVEDPKSQEDAAEPSIPSPKCLERSHSKTQAELAISSAKFLERSHSRKPSTSSPKPLERSNSVKKHESSPKPFGRSQSRKQVSQSSPNRLERSPLKTKKQVEFLISLPKQLDETPQHVEKLPQVPEEALQPSTSSPKPLERSHSVKGHETSPKPSGRSQSRKQVDTSPKPLERSPLQSPLKQVVVTYEPTGVSSMKHLDEAPQHEEKLPQVPEETIQPSSSSPKPLERSHSRKHSTISSPKPLGRSQVDTAYGPFTSPPKLLERSHSRKQAESTISSPNQVDPVHGPSAVFERSPLKTKKQVETSPKHVETPQYVETPKQMGKSPLSAVMETPPRHGESSPVVTPDPRSSTGRQGESRRRTKRMAVDAATTEDSPAQAVCLSTVSQEFLLGEEIGPGSAKVHALEMLKFRTPQKASPGDKSSSNPNSSTKTGSTKRSSAKRSLARSLHLDENGKNLSPQLTAVGTPDSCDRPVHLQPKSVTVGVVLPREEIFPGKTISLPQIRVRTPKVVFESSEANLSKNPCIGGSTRVTQRDHKLHSRSTRLAGSLPTSPARYTSGESRTARLLRKLNFTGRVSGKKRGSTQAAGKAMTDVGPKESTSELHRDFSEPRQLDFSFMNWTDPEIMLRESRADHDPAERSEVVHSDNKAFSSARRQQQGNLLSSETCDKKNETCDKKNETCDKKNETCDKKKSSGAWPWSFKWKWGPNSKAKPAKGANISKGNSISLPRPITNSPTADIMSDARDTFISQSDRFSSRGSTEKLALDRALKHRRVLSWGADSTSSLCSGSKATMAAFTPNQPRLAARDAQELLVPPRKLCVPDVMRRSQEIQVTVPELRRSANVLRSSSDTDIFEDCFGSFRSTDSPTKSFGSFRSIDSPTFSSSSIKKTTASSIDADEWESSSFRQEITGTNDEPCTSAQSKFAFKCSKVQQFNKFLRAQKERIRSGLDAGNSDRFCVVLTGRDLELSSIVAALSYAWLQENSFPKVSGDAWHPIPMIDIPRQQMDKHRDAAWLFDACGIDPKAVLFADEVELSTLVAAGRIKMSIIGQDVLVTRNEVGSVCTLLMEMLLAEHRGLLQPRYLKAFMLAGILVDTENLDFASTRDTAMSNFLVEGMGCCGRTTFYNQLREVEGDSRVSKLISQHYDNQPSARLKARVEAEHEHSDRDSIFTQSQDHTSTSEAGTNSSLDEDSPRPKLKQRNSFRYSRLPPHSAPAKSHRLSLPGGCIDDQDAHAVAHIRKAATQFGYASAAPQSCGQNPNRAKPGAFARIRKKLFFEK